MGRRSDRDPSADRSAAEPARVIRVVGVVGAGTMGAGIAQVALEAGAAVRLHDADPAAAARGADRIADGLARRAAKRAGTDGSDGDSPAGSPGATSAGSSGAPSAGPSDLERLEIAPSLEALADGADLVIEAAIEDLDAKRTIFRVLDRVAPRAAILATNTSSLSVAAIAAATADPGRVVGLHFFNPAAVMPLVEVVATPQARPDVAERAAATMASWGKTPVGCADTPGFIVNRVNRPFTLEALRIVEDDEATVDEVDAALRADGFPMGPFELMDLIGIDVNLAVVRSLYAAFGNDDRFRPSPLQARLVAAGELGRKTGSGFHRYPISAAETGSGSAPADPDREAAIAERVVLAIVNEAYRALGDGVATRADIDRALRLGAGHRRGPFERVAETGGPAAVARRLDHLAGRLGTRFEPAPALRAQARRTGAPAE